MPRRRTVVAALAAFVVAAAAAVLLVSARDHDTPPATLRVGVSDVLRPPFDAIAEQEPAAQIEPIYGTNADLTQAVRSGNGGDLIVTTGLEALNELQADGLVDQPYAFATDRLTIVYHLSDPDLRYDLESLIDAGIPIAGPAASSAFGEIIEATLAELPADQRTAVAANLDRREAGSAEILTDVASGTEQAGLVLESDVDAAERRAVEESDRSPDEIPDVSSPSSPSSALGDSWRSFAVGPAVSYAVALVTPPAQSDDSRSDQVQLAVQRAASAFVYRLVEGSASLPNRVLRQYSIASGPPSAIPYEAPEYVPVDTMVPRSSVPTPTSPPGGTILIPAPTSP